jgi:3-methylfumaryl-CoA hydratase
MTNAVELAEHFSLAQVRRVAAMLDIEPGHYVLGDPVPRGWHFALFSGETPRQNLRSDGFPGLGAPMPQLGRPRLLLGQRIMTLKGDLTVGGQVLRASSVTSIVEKTGRNGPLSIVTVDHRLTASGASEPAVTEQQTYYLPDLPAADARPVPKPAPQALPKGGETKVVTPDEVMLFQYSALGFNTHRIHFDRDYARTVEFHPDLVVNGGLATLLTTEFLRSDLGLTLKSLTARHLAPLYVGRPMTIHVLRPSHGAAQVQLLDNDGVLAVELAVTFDEL